MTEGERERGETERGGKRVREKLREGEKDRGTEVERESGTKGQRG